MSGMGITTAVSVESFREAAGPLVDVRTPREFHQGHWPGAINNPLFTDEQRHEVGLTYKQQGRHAAIQLGLTLCGPRLGDLSEALTRSAGGPAQPLRLYCWRGGMRSNSMAWLAGLSDHPVCLLEGGYKRYRQWVLQSFETPWPLKVLGGRTGTGKTDLLLELEGQNVAVVDLEGLAHHRGSSFGNLGLPEQPSTEHYENQLAETLEGHARRRASEIWLEAESAQVGRCRIPGALFQQMQLAPVLEIRRSDQERINRLVDVYAVHDATALREATERIQRRLGPQRTRVALEAIDQQRWDDACLAMLAYYDGCYDRELERKPASSTIDLEGIDPKEAAELLVERGVVTAMVCS